MVAPPSSALTPALCRAARGFLGWTQADLSAASGREVPTIRSYEREDQPDRASQRRADIGTIKLIEDAFRAEGLEFFDTGFRRRHG